MPDLLVDGVRALDHDTLANRHHLPQPFHLLVLLDELTVSTALLHHPLEITLLQVLLNIRYRKLRLVLHFFLFFFS
jgi:hypothetical protein